MKRKRGCPAPFSRLLFLNDAGVHLRPGMITDSNQNQRASIVFQDGRIIPVFDLGKRSCGCLVPFQFNDDCRKQGFPFWKIHDIRIPMAGWKLFDFTVPVNTGKICISYDRAQRLFVIVVLRRLAGVMNPGNHLCYNTGVSVERVLKEPVGSLDQAEKFGMCSLPEDLIEL